MTTSASGDKRNEIASTLKTQNVDAAFLTQLDSIASNIDMIIIL